jgi:predicted nucleic-acid-binding Zn-ribbon protein
MKPAGTCPNCDGTNLYASSHKVSSGVYAPNYLPGLNKLAAPAARFRVVVCTDCGLMRFFTDSDVTSQIPESKHWLRLIVSQPNKPG